MSEKNERDIRNPRKFGGFVSPDVRRGEGNSSQTPGEQRRAERERQSVMPQEEPVPAPVEEPAKAEKEKK